MKKLLLIFATLSVAFSAMAGPVTPPKNSNYDNVEEEGMWLPFLLSKYNLKEMKRLGMKLSAKDIYDVNKGSLKDAIVWFNGGCTGEIVSEEGLLLTNHHCGYDAISDLSTVNENLLKNGFFAKTKAEERPAKGLFVTFMVRMEDVSEQIMPQLKDLTGDAKEAKMKELIDGIVKTAKEDGKYEAFVRDMFKNNQYILFVSERYTDIRLVGNPPESIGKFGGDSDNWMWPRQTGDFSMFRVYANKENKPAAYSAENVPMKPKHFLPISLKGVKEGDFAMVFGFPGRTNRYENSFGVQLAIDQINPAIVKLRERRLELMMDEMKKDEAVRLQQASKYASLANYWKYFIGQTEQIKRLKVVDEKRENEKVFQVWANDRPEYKNILSEWEQAYIAYRPYAKHATYLSQGIFGSQIVSEALPFIGMEKAMEAGNFEEQKAAILANRKSVDEEFFMIYNMASDKRILAEMLLYFYQDIPKEQHPAILAEIVKGQDPAIAFTNYANEATATTIFNNQAKLDAFYANPSADKLNADPIYKLAKGFYENYINNFAKYSKVFGEINAELGHKYMKAYMEINAGKPMYPDANSTMRLTYGSVKEYEPKDGVTYNYYTTVKGIEEKYKPGDYEFDAPAKMLQLIKDKDYGQYADKEIGEVVTCFLTDNDITGGNSGSPVINAKGELIGLAFDGNWEAMSGDIVFDKRYKRTISVDIRYVLFIIDKFGGATNLINEMKIMK